MYVYIYIGQGQGYGDGQEPSQDMHGGKKTTEREGSQRRQKRGTNETKARPNSLHPQRPSEAGARSGPSSVERTLRKPVLKRPFSKRV